MAQPPEIFFYFFGAVVFFAGAFLAGAFLAAGFLAAAGLGADLTGSDCVIYTSGAVVSPARDGPVRPVEEEAKDVRTEINAAPAATVTASMVEAVKTPAASAPIVARRVWAKVLTARSVTATKKLVLYINSSFCQVGHEVFR
jgi:hypothetical protein